MREVHAELAADRDIAYTTVMTVMDRLARKELVTQERDGRAFRYRARTSRAAMTAELMRETLDDFSEQERSHRPGRLRRGRQQRGPRRPAPSPRPRSTTPEPR